MLNLSFRQSGEGVFSQSTAQISLRKNRMLASTGLSNLRNSMQLNNSMNSGKLPQLSRSSSSSKSTKLKLTVIQATLMNISQSLQELRMDTRESRRYCNFLKDDLAENTLGSLRLDLANSIGKFNKSFKLSKKNDEDRSKALNFDCQKLRQSSKNLKSLLSNIQQRLDKCQNVMGIYSGKQKHKL